MLWTGSGVEVLHCHLHKLRDRTADVISASQSEECRLESFGDTVS